MPKGLTLLLPVLILLTGCATVRVDPLSEGHVVPDDERALRERAGEYDTALGEAGYFVEDEELHAYLVEVTDRVRTAMGLPVGAEVEIRVVRSPFLNASALSNGTIHLHTGILARLENEAQLATLLGHELAHYSRRHSVSEARTRARSEAQANTLGTISLLLALTGNPVALALAGVGVAAGPVLETQLTGYSRDLEREADIVGFEAMVGAGYAPAQSVRFFELLLAEEETNPVIDDAYYYSDHPAMQERIESYRRELARLENAAAGDVRATEYATAIREILVLNAGFDLNAGRNRSARLALDRHLESGDGSHESWLLLARWHETRNDEENRRAAADAYRNATELDDASAAAWRGLGLAERTLGNPASAAEALARAIELDPEASDRLVLDAYVRELSVEAGGRSVKPFLQVLCVALLAAAPAGSSAQEWFRVPAAEVTSRVKTVALAPARWQVQGDAPADLPAAAEEALAQKLQASGLSVVGSAEYAKIWRELSTTLGGTYDTATGAPLPEPFDAAIDHTRMELRRLHGIDAIVYWGYQETSLPFEEKSQFLAGRWWGVGDQDLMRDGKKVKIVEPVLEVFGLQAWAQIFDASGVLIYENSVPIDWFSYRVGSAVRERPQPERLGADRIPVMARLFDPLADAYDPPKEKKRRRR